MSMTVMTEDQQVVLDIPVEAPRGGVRVLTAKGGDFSISDELRSVLALLDDGRLLISGSHAFSPHVRGFIGRLRHQGHPFTLHQTDINVIAQYYSGNREASDHSDMQREALKLFTAAVNLRASDIHIRVSKRSSTKFYFRIHNDLEFQKDEPYEYGNKLCTSIYHAMADVSDATFEHMERQDARISERSKLPDTLDGIRIATTPQVDGYIMVLRLLYNDTNNDTSLLALGFNETQSDAVEYMKKRPTGVVIIGGPTGSGKSTTLQRTLTAIINETGGRKHIITVEDPPEYPIPGAVQTPVTNADSEEARSREYQKAIKAAMRLDPDIIMVSEIRDNPTARLSVQAAMTGHQVWATVHANSALAIMDRLSDLGVPVELLADPTIVAGLICQRLIKTLCPHCKQPFISRASHYPERDVRRIMSVVIAANVYVHGEGCEHCRGYGTLGRTVVAETVVTDNQLMTYLRNQDRMRAIEYWRNEQGGQSMLEHAITKINAGLVDPFHAEDVVGSLDAVMIERDHRVGSMELKGR